MKNQQTSTDTKKPDFYAAFKASVQDQFDINKNPKGFVMFGPSVNSKVMPKTLQYLPNFVNFQDLNYCQFGGNKQFKQIIAEGTPYTKQQTLSATNIQGAIDAFCLQYQSVSFEGIDQIWQEMKFLEYSKAKIVSQKQSKCHFVYINCKISQQKLTSYQKAKKTIVLIIKNKRFLKKIQNPNIYMLYTYQIFGQSISCAVTHNINPENLQKLAKYFNQHYISTFTQAIIVSKTKNIEFKSQQNSQNQLKKGIIKKIQINNKTKIKKQNVLIFQGATGALSFLARAFFNDGDSISFDVPCYPGIEDDFEIRVKLKYYYNDLYKSRLIERVKRAKKNGSKAYVIVNPNNPTGYVYGQNDIRQVCEWALENQDFVLIFDEMYINLIYGDKNSLSSVSYSKMSSNIVTIQGFAKQYGLCGFKIGYIIHSNKNLSQNYNRWKSILIPPKYSLQIIDQMLKKSNYGHKIIEYSKKVVKQSMQYTMKILDQYNIPYIKPIGGCFVWIDLSKYIQKHNKITNQNLLFEKIFYGYKLNIICGKAFNCPIQGFVRLCTVTDKQIVRQGLQRLNRMIKDHFIDQQNQNLTNGMLSKKKKIKKKQKLPNTPALTKIKYRKLKTK